MLVPTPAARGLHRLARCFRGRGAQGRRDAGHVEPLRAGKNRGPVDHARFDAGDGRSFAVVENRAGPRCRAELEEVDADAIVLRPDDVIGGDAGFTRMIGDEPAEGVVGEARNPGRRVAEMRQADGGIEFGAADLDVEAARLFETMKVGRTESDHRFAEGHNFVRHGGSQKTTDDVSCRWQGMARRGERPAGEQCEREMSFPLSPVLRGEGSGVRGEICD